MTVLVVDDENDVAELIQLLLEEEGHSCLIAKDVDEAEWTLQMARVDGMALDLSMPGRDPLQWLEELALARPELTRRTLVITGRLLDEREVLRVRACGAGILQKPFRIQEFRDAILRRVSPTAADAPSRPVVPPESGEGGRGARGERPHRTDDFDPES